MITERLGGRWRFIICMGDADGEVYRLQKLRERKEKKEQRGESIEEVARFRILIFWVHATRRF